MAANKNTYYFSHDCNAREDDKIVALRMEKGAAGYGLYWLLLELLSTSPNCEFECNYNIVAYVLHESAKEIKEVVEKYGLFQITEDKKRFFSARLKEQMIAVKELKNKRVKAANQRWKGYANAMQVQSTCNASAVQVHINSDANQMQVQPNSDANLMQVHAKSDAKESKGKESKGKENNISSKEENKSDGKPPDDEAEVIEDNGIYINYAHLIEYWNKATGGQCGRLESIENNRRKMTRARIIAHGKRKFQEAIDRAAKSEFLMGSPWFNYDWFVRPNNFDKVITGNYDNKPNGTDTDTNTSTDARKHVTKPTGGGFTADF